MPLIVTSAAIASSLVTPPPFMDFFMAFFHNSLFYIKYYLMLIYIMTNLEDNWILWYHSTKNNNWDKNSYAILSIYKTVNDICQLKKLLPLLNKYPDKMLFLMRKRDKFIYPSWEDNLNGGTLCFALDSLDTDLFLKLSYNICGENLYIDKKSGNNHINGISISPKSNKYVLKIWYSTIPFSDISPNELALKYINLWDSNIYKLLSKYKSYFVRHKTSKIKDNNIIRKTNMTISKRRYNVNSKWR